MRLRYFYGDELYHHGVKGQVWGLRRYQNEDGSLTPLGKERRAAQLKKARVKAAKIKARNKKREEKKVAKEARREERKALKEAREAAKRKQVKVVRMHDLSKYSDEELREKTNRLKVENDYLRVLEDYAKLNPKAVSAGERFMNGLKKTVSSSLSQAASNVGKEYMEKVLRNMILPDKKEQALTREQKIEKYGLEGLTDDELNKKLTRMGKENQYIDLFEGNTSSSNKKKNKNKDND